ncbi:hypothetical protein FS935_14230 [Metabacillus litoralis]|uniref:Radical SAM protein n=1 Tax=Metabacillus litoralis TaxID=152268 RepID=A0A5C6VYZ8_9BACI|nr:hypothetical protein [Metabacillus litoralis]TXC90214.1 hypothetical protein FS935_14230 [Metabacillus litoralis]
MNEYFTYNPRLKIYLPKLDQDWNSYSLHTQNSILADWEHIRGHIPDRIAELEEDINLKQEALNEEENFLTSCELTEEISELASIINDLWIWYRSNQQISKDKVHT